MNEQGSEKTENREGLSLPKTEIQDLKDVTLEFIELALLVLAAILSGAFLYLGLNGYFLICASNFLVVGFSYFLHKRLNRVDLSRYFFSIGQIVMCSAAVFVNPLILSPASFFYVVFPMIFAFYSNLKQNIIFSFALIGSLCASWLTMVALGEEVLAGHEPLDYAEVVAFFTCYGLSFGCAAIFQYYGESIIIKMEAANLALSESLKEKEEIEHHLLLTNEMANIGSWSLNTETGALWWSRQTYAIHDLEPDYEVKVEEALDFYADEAKPIITAAVEKGLVTGEGWDLELPFITAKKRRIWVHAKGGPYLDESGVKWLKGTFQDITTRRKTLKDLEKAREQAEKASHAKGRFLANMSHEIRTPMNGVLATTDLLIQENLSEDQTKLVETIRSSGESMLEILNDILDFSKIESGYIDLDPHTFDLRSMMCQVFELFDSPAVTKGLKIDLNLAEEVPQWVLLDATRLRQIVLNLVSNAIKFTKSGGVLIEVTANKVDSKNCICHISVSDTGIGISKEKAASIFEEFSQGDVTTTREFGGTGLGLAICQRLARLLGSEIKVDTELEKGSRFHFSINCPVVRPPQNEESTDAGAAWDRGAQISVLVVEDNKINQDLACLVLGKFGIKADLAENGKVALEMIEKNSYEIIFMDCQMPVLDGYETTRLIRAMADIGQPKIIAMTANAMKGDREKCLAAGMNDYLSKPISRKSIGQQLKKWAA